MGECTYYMKAQFKTSKEAGQALPLIQQFLREAKEAYDFWQGNRRIHSRAFWREFSKKFPMTTAYTKESKLYGKDQEDLVGHLDFGQEDEDIENIYQEVAAIGYAATNVWHFMDWSNLAAFIKSYFKAIRVVVSSDENGTGSLEDLDLYDYQAIVEAIVKKAKKFSGLHNEVTGIHPDLNFLLNLN